MCSKKYGKQFWLIILSKQEFHYFGSHHSIIQISVGYKTKDCLKHWYLLEREKDLEGLWFLSRERDLSLLLSLDKDLEEKTENNFRLLKKIGFPVSLVAYQVSVLLGKKYMLKVEFIVCG